METREQNLNYATSVITNLAPAREIENEEKILYKTIDKAPANQKWLLLL